MFSHQGKTRTNLHNLELASLLSFVAGLVNVVGFMAVRKLTTNVTGHFAYFIDEAFRMNFSGAFHIALFVFFFFLGAFCSNFMVEVYSRFRESMIYVVPTLAEALILLVLAFLGSYIAAYEPDYVAFCLLFAMGMQNSLVTSISHSVVRTTHLTGLFTDMGIEFSQLFFYHDKENRRKLFRSIRLRPTIIWLFFFGGVAGGILYPYFGMKTLLFGALILLGGLAFDFIKIQLLLHKRRSN